VKFSIIINNYNYARFVGQAIESAIMVDWQDKEIIVVDDGSTDESRAVIGAFDDRIIPIFIGNGGQAQAANVGFNRSTGDMVIFLDSDDLLLPSVAKQVVAAWRPGIAKVQYGVMFVDQTLRSLGVQWPVYTEHDTPELVSRSMRQSGAYRNSPTSGNVWSRDFLVEAFPLPTREQGLQWIDTYLNKLAPFFGAVVSLTSPQCLYRRHAVNDSAFADAQQYLDRYPRSIQDLDIVVRLANELLRRKGQAAAISCNNEYYGKLSLVSKRFFPEQYTHGLPMLLLRYWQAVFHEALLSFRHKALLVVWSLAVVATPRRMACLLVLSRERHAIADARSRRRPFWRIIEAIHRMPRDHT
jgi:glycosyltransferase involved in cell wall biosynthesis